MGNFSIRAVYLLVLIGSIQTYSDETNGDVNAEKLKTTTHDGVSDVEKFRYDDMVPNENSMQVDALHSSCCSTNEITTEHNESPTVGIQYPESQLLPVRISRAIHNVQKRFIQNRKMVPKSAPKHTQQTPILSLEDEMFQRIVERFDPCYSIGSGDTCKLQAFCSCEDDCWLHGDCCIDANITINKTRDEFLKSIVNRLKCTKMSEHGIYKIVTSCPPERVETDLRSQCDNVNETNVLSFTPVYDSKLKLSYRNIYCARCNLAISDHLQFWNIILRRCRFWDITPGIPFIEFIEYLLKDPDLSCRLTASPKETFRTDLCLPRYNEGYVCDDADLNDGETFESSSVVLRQTTEGTIEETKNIGQNLTTSNSSVPRETRENVSDHSYGFSASSLKNACFAYKMVTGFLTSLTKTVYYRNGVCAWCKQKHFGKSHCFSRNYAMEKMSSMSVLINFHRAIDILQGEKGDECKENEVLDPLKNECRALICPSRHIASYGKCIKAYSKVSTASFGFTMYMKCGQTSDIAALKTAVYDYMGELFHNIPRQIILKDKFQQSLEQKYCYSQCVIIRFVSQVTRQFVEDVTKLSKRMLEVDSRNNTISISKLNKTNIYSTCLESIQDERNDSVPCPSIIINESDFEVLKERHKDLHALLDNVTVSNINNTLMVCYEAYKSLLEFLTSEKSEYTENQHVLKVTLSLTLISLSLLALILSSYIYITHPDLKSVPCRMTLNIMLNLIVTCLLFILTNLFDTNEDVCFVLAFLTQYFWLCVFVWFVLSGFHTMAIFSKLVTNQANRGSTKARSGRRLYIYGFLAYVIPSLMTSCFVALDRTSILKMDYGVPTCFINNHKILLLTFGLPVMVMVAFNLIFLIISTLKMYIFLPDSDAGCLSTKRTVLQTGVKLFFSLGLTWIFGLIAALTNDEVFWYLHIVFNSSHGIFMFMVFIVCSRVVSSCGLGKCHNTRESTSNTVLSDADRQNEPFK